MSQNSDAVSSNMNDMRIKTMNAKHPITPSPPRHIAGVVACTLAITLFAVSGCERTKVSDSPIVVDYAAEDTGAELNYWHGLAERPLVTNDEALHGLVLFANGTDPATGYEQRVGWLKERGYLSGGFGGAANEAVDCGTIAQVLASSMDIKGGLTMRVLGPHPRYALRELIYLGIMNPGTHQQGISGIEFVGVLSRAETYKKGQL